MMHEKPIRLSESAKQFLRQSIIAEEHMRKTVENFLADNPDAVQIGDEIIVSNAEQLKFS